MRCVVPLLAVFSLAFVPAPLPKPPSTKDDLKKLQGTWSRVALTIDGKKGAEKPGDVTIVITGTHMQFPSPSDAWTITLDASKTPKVFDTQSATPHHQRSIFRGIYRLEGDQLTLCSREGEVKDRPAGFDPAQPGVWLQVYKRKKS